MDTDVRDLGGRLGRLAVAVVIGVCGALAITFALPTRDHFPGPVGGCGFSHITQGWVVEGGDPVLILTGCIAIASLVYAVLGALGRAAPRARLPRAIVRQLHAG